MMKTLCVAVVVLSLTSVCQSASLACERLLKPVDKGPDLSGRWYLIAMSSDICLVPGLINSLFLPSIAVDITSKETPNIYQYDFKINMYGYCTNESDSFFYGNNAMFNVDSNNAATGEPEVLLQSGCPDCVVTKGNDIVDTLMLYSRRKTVTAAELKEFETQADCLGWVKPEVLNSDYEYENCKSFDIDSVDIETSGLSEGIYQRLNVMFETLLKCLTEIIIRGVSEWVQQMWNSLW